MNKQVKAKLKSLESYNEKPIGIFGARGSGKTMFFTVLYGLSGFNNEEGKFSVICSDKESRQYLKKNYTFLLDGKLPPRTEINDITSINMSYFYNKNSYSLRSFDFAGELLKEDPADEQSKEAFANLQKKVYDFFLNCSGILFFIEPGTDKKEGFERQSEIDKLLSFLKEQKGRWDFNIPIGLVITKWDKVSKDISEKSLSILKYNNESLNAIQEKIFQNDTEEEQKKAEEFVKTHPIYNNIFSLLSGVSEHVKIFPVSAFGHAKENDLPPDELKPFNLFSPLIWIAEKRDYEWQKKIKEAIANSRLSSSFAKKIVSDFKNNVENKKLIDSVEAEYSLFKHKKAKKKLIASFIIAAVFSTAGAYSLAYKTSQKKLYDQIINNKEISLEEKVAKIDIYQKRYGVFHNYIGKYLTNDEYAVKLKKEGEQTYLNMIYSEQNIDKKIAYIDKFIINYPDSQFIKELKELKEFSQFTKLIQGENNGVNKYRKYMSFLNHHPNYKEKEIILAEAKKYLTTSERSGYEDIITFRAQNTDKTDLLFEKIDSYLAIPEFVEYRKEISELRENLKDDFLFKNVTKSVDAYNLSLEVGFLKDVTRNCESYLSNSSVGRYVEKTKSYLAQVNKIEKGILSEIEFYASGEGNGKLIELQVKSNRKNYSLSEKPLSNNSVYLGSVVTTVQINMPIEVKIYLTDSRGAEEEFNPGNIKIIDANQFVYLTGPKGSSIGIQMKLNIDNFKLR